MQSHKLGSLILAAIILVAFAGPLFGHASVNPRTSEAGVHHKIFYVRAQVEKEIPVVELGFEVSQEWRDNGGDVNSFQDIPGYELHVDFDENGKVERFYWTGTRAVVETFQMINVSMKVPEEPGLYPFKSWQKYSDGSVVWWNEPGAKGCKILSGCDRGSTAHPDGRGVSGKRNRDCPSGIGNFSTGLQEWPQESCLIRQTLFCCVGAHRLDCLKSRLTQVSYVGADTVALSSDWGGYPVNIKGIENAGEYQNIAQALLKRGYSDGDVAKIMGENLLRVFDEVVRTARN